MSNPLKDVHPMRALHWLETHCAMDTPDGLVPEELELEIWELYLYGKQLTSEPLIRSLALMHICGSGDVE